MIRQQGGDPDRFEEWIAQLVLGRSSSRFLPYWQETQGHQLEQVLGRYFVPQGHLFGFVLPVPQRVVSQVQSFSLLQIELGPRRPSVLG